MGVQGMISEAPRSRAIWVKPSDADGAYREDFLTAVSHVGLWRDQAVALVEAQTGRPFAKCSPRQFLPVLQELLQLLRRHATPLDPRPPCHA